MVGVVPVALGVVGVLEVLAEVVPAYLLGELEDQVV